jgi:hypothetical protein
MPWLAPSEEDPKIKKGLYVPDGHGGVIWTSVVGTGTVLYRPMIGFDAVNHLVLRRLEGRSWRSLMRI